MWLKYVPHHLVKPDCGNHPEITVGALINADAKMMGITPACRSLMGIVVA